MTDEIMLEELARIGVQVRIAHFTGDNSYPTEYTLRYSFVSAVGPTIDLALLAFTEQLLKHVPVEQANAAIRYNAEMDTRNRIAYESREKPWLPLDPDE